MTFPFDGGDILLLIFVGIILFIFRRLDRTNRSLEKVRRYADKSKDSLDAIVQEHALSLKELSLNLETQEKNNREILAHTETTKEKILAYTKDFQNHEERMENQKQSLEELNNLALRVDKNLIRLKEESLYVDKVGSDLTQIKETFKGLEEKDQARFSSFRDTVLSQFQTTLDKLQGNLDETHRQISFFSETMETLQSRHEQIAEEKVVTFQDSLERVEEEFRARLETVASEGADLEDAAFHTLNTKIEERHTQLEENWMGGITGLKDKVSAALASIDKKIKESQETMENWEEENSQRLGQSKEKLEETEEKFLAHLETLAAEGADREEAAFHTLNTKIEERHTQLEENWMGGITGLKDKVSAALASIDKKIKESQETMENWEEENSQRLGQSKQKLEETETAFEEIRLSLEARRQEINQSVENLQERLENFTEERETNLLEDVEKKQKTYRKTIENRFERLESFTQDMDILSESLKISQQKVVLEVENTFTLFRADIAEQHELEKTRVAEESSEMKTVMNDLESELDELKSRAYDNVSEKLQIFEDEFFQTLKDRHGQMNITLEEWEKNAEIQLNDLGSKATRERTETERLYSTELKKRLNALQTSIFSQFESFQNLTDDFKESLSGRITSTEEDFSRLHKELALRIAQEKEASQSEFSQAFEKFDKEVKDKLIKADSSIGKNLTTLSGDIQTRQRELEVVVQSKREELSEWRQRLDANMEEGQRESIEKMDILKSQINTQIEELRDEYTGNTAEFILQSGQDRSTLRKEITKLEESVIKASSQITEKSRDTLDTLKEQGENFLFDFRKNTHEIRDEVEKKVKELRQNVGEVREKAENTRKEMVAHTDAEYARLTHNLDEIDRRQRAFISETRVFERADELKESLETDIQTLERNLESLGADREEIKTIRREYEHSNVLHQEISGKLNKFFSEQQKVENLEGKITRINSLSESVDHKLNRVNEANDSLQELHLGLKNLEDLHEDLNGRYEGLQGKSTMLETASTGIEQNFERMREIETSLKNISARFYPLNDNLIAAEELQEKLFARKDMVDNTVEKVMTLDSTLTELDERIEKLDQAREWLARTETRLEKIGKETQDKVRLLGTLSQQETGGKRLGSSPDMSTREMVVRLAREGWNSGEIARTTKLSRGEVELILELTPKVE